MQHILITGGNAGIGKATAKALAFNKSKIFLACRNEQKANEAVNDIKKETGNNEVYYINCDLSSFDSIRSCSNTFIKKIGKLDILINNAGLVTDKLLFTKDGFELQFGVNHLGHFLLTNQFINLILKSSEGRIINVSSNAHFKGKINFDSFRGEPGQQKFNRMAYYSQSKLANVLFTKELARRHPSICTHSLSPGIVNTKIAQKNGNSSLWKMAWKMFAPFMKSPEKGASTSIYLAQSKAPLSANGKYYQKKKQIASSDLSNDQTLAKKLWEVSASLVK